MKLVLFLTLILTAVSSYGQNVAKDSSKTCLQVANELSYYWKLDSLANNGFRLYTHQKLLTARPDKIYADVLVTNLVPPNETRRTNKGTEYLYYFFDIRTMPNHYNAPRACWYIVFKFENDSNYLTSIEQGDIDR